MKENINRKPLYALIGVTLVSIIGVTFAYFTDTVEIPNVFKTKQYSTEVTEEFVSPDDWKPGTVTDKTVIATNTGDVEVAVRVSYTEEWKSKDNTPLELQQDGQTAAIINFANTSDWIENNGYYYYKSKLSKGQSTKTFINSVKFNENIKSQSTCTKSTDNLTTTCTSTGKGYDGATYTLNIKVETVQFDKYKEAWNTNVTID